MSDVEEIKNRLSVVELIGEYIRLQKAGSSWKALCPFHNEKTPSFMVSEERRSFHCFGCGKGGDIFTFVMEMEGIGFREALEQLAQKAGVELKKTGRVELREKTSEKKRLYEILELATKWYEKNLWEGRGKEKILGYLRERGLNGETIRKFRLGYAPEGWRNLLEFLTKRGYKPGEINKTGLLVEKNPNQVQNPNFKIQNTDYYDRFRDRIMFPIQDVMGRVVGFSARVAPGGNEKTAKYINTPQTILYDKSKILYGLNLAKTEIKKRGETIIVEGNMDVIASHQAGFPNTIAVSGTALTPEQAKTMKRYAESAKISFDMDTAGQEAVKRSLRVCLQDDLDARIVLLDKGKDAAEVVRENPESWKKSIEGARRILDYFFEDAFSRHDPKDPVGKKKIAHELLNVVKDIANPIERSHWARLLSEKIGTAEKNILEVLEKVRLKKENQGEESYQAQAKGRRSSRTDILAKKIVGILIAFPGECETERAKIQENDFQKAEYQKIVSLLKRGVDLQGVKAAFPDYETGKFLDEAVFEAEVEFGDSSQRDPALEIGECIKNIRKENLKTKVEKIAQDIREAEKSNDREAMKNLMEEFQRLVLELSNLR